MPCSGLLLAPGKLKYFLATQSYHLAHSPADVLKLIMLKRWHALSYRAPSCVLGPVDSDCNTLTCTLAMEKPFMSTAGSWSRMQGKRKQKQMCTSRVLASVLMVIAAAYASCHTVKRPGRIQSCLLGDYKKALAVMVDDAAYELQRLEMLQGSR